MIIGINGKIGSGKDTVGRIAQCLINHPKVTNKDLLWMIENNVVAEEYSKCEIKKFAGKLKQTASLLTGIPVEDFEDQEFKKTELGEDWNYCPIIGYGHRNVPVYGEPEQPMFVREFLQKLGTEAMRDGLHTNVWVNALFADYKGPKMSEYNPSNWIITDMRFPNEMDAIIERHGLTIRVIRPYDYSKGIKKSELDDILNTTFNKIESPSLHPSETALDDAEFDYEIINDGTIEDLVEKVKEILITEKII